MKTEFEVGDLVKIINDGHLYARYDQFAIKYNLEKWERNKNPDCSVLYEIVLLKKHLRRTWDYLAVIKCLKSGRQYIIDIKGLLKEQLLEDELFEITI